ncbi:MAG TPA: DUF4214 domain-containing protein [Pirellulales bacterium]|nr:DUF4214 domain-containing protein [Pirellulales bacterium]
MERLDERLLLAANPVTLFHDDFSGAALDATAWLTPTGPASFYGRTQIRAAEVPVPVVGSLARLQLDTYNPTARTPGDSFYGSEIVSNQTFAPTADTEVVIEARVRAEAPFPKGLVDAFFLYSLDPGGASRDEIDFELLGNDAINQQVLTNSYDHDDFNQPGDNMLVNMAGLDPTGFNTFRIDWSLNHIEWFINDHLLREKDGNLPTSPMQLHFNTWAPDPSFSAAYSSTLRPASSPSGNQEFTYDLDNVTVRAIRDVDYHDVVQNLYQAVLGRSPDAAGAEYWFGQLTSGVASVGQMASGFFESDERLNPLIRQMYRDYLFREPDEAGLAYWRDQVWKRDGGSDNVIAGIVSSDEFFRATGGNNRDWVAAVYQRQLGRTADPAGLDFWTARLDDGSLSREQAVLGFVRSPENFNDLVHQWFQQYLRRDATADDTAFFVGLLQAGASQRDVQITILDSDEFARLRPTAIVV